MNDIPIVPTRMFDGILRTFTDWWQYVNRRHYRWPLAIISHIDYLFRLHNDDIRSQSEIIRQYQRCIPITATVMSCELCWELYGLHSRISFEFFFFDIKERKMNANGLTVHGINTYIHWKYQRQSDRKLKLDFRFQCGGRLRCSARRRTVHRYPVYPPTYCTSI